MDNFRKIYDKELGLDGVPEEQTYTPLEVVILDSTTVRMFVYEVCKRLLEDAEGKDGG